MGGGRGEDGLGDGRFEAGVGRRRVGCARAWGTAGNGVWAAWAAGTTSESGLDPIKLQLNPEEEVWDLPAPSASLPAPAGALNGGREAPGQSFKGPFRGNSALINDWRQDQGRFLAPRLPGQHEGSASRAPLSKVRAAASPAPPLPSPQAPPRASRWELVSPAV